MFSVWLQAQRKRESHCPILRFPRPYFLQINPRYNIAAQTNLSLKYSLSAKVEIEDQERSVRFSVCLISLSLLR